MTKEADNLDPVARLARLQESLAAKGMRFVSEAELAAERIRTEERRKRFKAARSPVKCERQASKALLRKLTHEPVEEMRYKESDLPDDFEQREEAQAEAVVAAMASRVGQVGDSRSSSLRVLGDAPSGARQAAFQASGRADSANGVLLEFFSLPHNFGLWFKSTVLEALTKEAGHPSSRMNNRAIDLRPVFIERGHYIDQANIRDEHTDRVSSCYRVCAIEDALSLSDEKKAALLAQLKERDRQV